MDLAKRQPDDLQTGLDLRPLLGSEVRIGSSLAEGNAALAEQLALVNDPPFRGQQVSRRALFEELERAALQPLPFTW